MADDPQLRAERRAFIRDHHPQRGGDPDEFIAGLHRLIRAARHRDELHPILARLESLKWIDSSWESVGGFA